MQDFKQLLQAAQEHGEFLQLHLYYEASDSQQLEAFALLADQGFFKLCTTAQGQVFATSRAIQALYIGVPANQQPGVTSTNAAAAAAGGGSQGPTNSLWGAIAALFGGNTCVTV